MMTISFKTVAGYREAALEKLSQGLGDYVENTSGSGRTLAANLRAFSNYQLVPRVLRGATSVNTKVNVLGREIDSPIMIAPTAFHKMFCERGEAETSEAARILRVPYVLSSFSTSNFEEVDMSNTWYQLLVYKDRALVGEYIRRAEDAGCSAIVLTVDAPGGCSMCNPEDKEVKFPIQNLPLLPVRTNMQQYESLQKYYRDHLNPGQSWADVEWIRSYAHVPVILKGILHPEDALVATKIGVGGIIISNHGGRQLDNAISTLDALALLPEGVNQAIDVYMDGGIRTGGDIFKALALGAKAVLIGRPIIYALAVNGADGVLDIVQNILILELVDCMRLTGCATIDEIGEDRIYDALLRPES